MSSELCVLRISSLMIELIDFYSSSSWIEAAKIFIYSNIWDIKPMIPRLTRLRPRVSAHLQPKATSRNCVEGRMQEMTFAERMSFSKHQDNVADAFFQRATLLRPIATQW